jgi:hypothetical protein
MANCFPFLFSSREKEKIIKFDKAQLELGGAEQRTKNSTSVITSRSIVKTRYKKK